jgi:hypothetical protein
MSLRKYVKVCVMYYILQLKASIMTTKSKSLHNAILPMIAAILLFLPVGVAFAHSQVDNLNGSTSNLIAKSLIQQDNNSDDWWKPVVKKHGINYESYTVHKYYVVLGKKTINGDIESFNDVVAISKSKEVVDGYIIYKTRTASFDSKRNELTINDCTMDIFGWNSKSTEPVKSYTHILIVADFNKNTTLMADVPQKSSSRK